MNIVSVFTTIAFSGVTVAGAAYVADTTDPADRGVAYAVLFGSLFLTLAGGPLLGIYIANVFGLTVLYYISLILVVASFIYTALFVRESVDENHIKKQSKVLQEKRSYLPDFRKELEVVKKSPAL